MKLPDSLTGAGDANVFSCFGVVCWLGNLWTCVFGDAQHAILAGNAKNPGFNLPDKTRTTLIVKRVAGVLK